MNVEKKASTSQQRQYNKSIVRINSHANVLNPSELCKEERGEALVFEYFSKFIGTTLDCSFGTGMLRNSITYLVDNLEKRGVLGVVRMAPDRHTGHTAKYYSTRKELWLQNQPQLQLTFKFMEG